MLRDVFYFGNKPNVHPREQHATNLVDARRKATTEHFWVINEFCDYTNFDWDFDFEFLPDCDVWAEEHNNVWPSYHQKDSGTWLCPKERSDVIVYRADVDPLKRKNVINSNWKLLENIDTTKWDFSWHPDPTDPPYIYKWGSKYAPVELKSCIEYHVEGAVSIKYMNTTVELLPNWDCLIEYQKVDHNHWDMSWRPDPLDPPFIYVWGNKYVDGKTSPTLEYTIPGATEKKFMNELIPVLPIWDKWEKLEDIVEASFDFAWRPNPTSPPYIYAWGNQWNKPEDKISIQYVVEGATEYKYMEQRAKRKPCMDNWDIPTNIDTTGFDFSWEPSPADPAYIYEFGTQWQKTGGPRYVVPGATEVKYIDFQKVKALPTEKNWTVPDNLDITGFDFSWHPDSTSPPYIYHFATQWALTGGPVYTCEGATEVKYLETPSAIALPSKANWQYDPKLIDQNSFDFSWHPYVEDQPYIYVFGTQHQKTGGPRYITPGALSTSPVKYIDTRILKATRLPNKQNFSILGNYKIKDFDWSWHPDETEEPYIYVFGNTQHPAEIMPTIEYVVEGAKQIKYVNDVVATLDEDRTNWVIHQPIDESLFDFTWKPNPKDPAYIYEFGTQWQKTGGPRYVVPGATEIKYVDIRATVLPQKNKFTVKDNLVIENFDFSWHPDSTEEPYIYVFGNNQHPATIMPTIEYVVEGATQIKYVDNIVAKLGTDKTNWDVPEGIDTTGFDFSWKPNPKDPAYIYEFSTQWQKTGGPRYVMPGATETKYVDIKATALPQKNKFTIKDNLVIESFDFSWHPDSTEEPYIYVFGNNQYPAEIMSTIEYHVEGATTIKYVNDVVAKLGKDMSNWDVPLDVDTTGFDFTWKPNPKDPAYVYEFGTQHQKTGGPRYVVSGATETKYIDTMKVKKLSSMDNWIIPKNIDVTDFDFSWHPDNTDPLYIYQFGTQWALSGGPRYVMPDAKEIKYMDSMVATALPNKENWQVPSYVDATSFDFSWHPYAEDEPYIYQFGTQHQKTGGPRYVTPGSVSTSPVKYIDTRILKSVRKPNKANFSVLNNYKIKDFDWSWHPDDTEEPYIYVFGNDQYAAEIMPTIEYAVEGAKQIKYVPDVIATLDVDMTNWEVPDNIDATGFDFRWKPNPKDPAYNYEFGTQWQKTGGPRYVVPGAIETKYVDTMKVTKLADKSKFAILDNLVVDGFDYSWHPDSTEEPYIYVFGNNLYPATIMPTIEYVVDGATQIKYIDSIVAKLGVDKTNWEIPDNVEISSIDFNWKPNPKDPPYIYQFGTQHQKTGGPRYVVPGATSIKYVGINVVALPQKQKFAILDNLVVDEFDYSWHPDSTDEPYIYVFGNTQHPAEIMPTIEYVVEGATQIKYVPHVLAKLGKDMSNWEVPSNLDVSEFDFSWKPNPKDPAYIYEFGTQWQKTGGPRYVVPGAIEVKYVTTQQAKVLPNKDNWTVPDYVDVTNFDFSWHPDSTSPPYIYHFATQWALTGGPIYKCEGATEVKYLEYPSAIALPNRENWEIPTDIDVDGFDFSWHPYVEDQPYVYVFGTQHQKTGGPRYITPGVIPTSPVKYIDTRIIKAQKSPNKDNFAILNNYKIKDFDWSWHPDETDEPYIYVFGNTQHPAEIMPTIEYVVPGATQIKYVNTIVATLDVDMTNWEVPEGIDTTEFDFSWKPNPKDPAYIYEFGTQWQKTGGPRYVVPGATEVKYVTTQKAKMLPNMSKWELPTNVDVTDFDFSWHPDNTSPPYIYHFATQWALSGGPIYRMDGATEPKYLEEPCAKALPNKDNWIVPEDIDVSNFDFSWHPYVEDQPYIYQFGTQHQKTGGPKYITPGALSTSPVKYIDTRILKATKLPNKKNFAILNNYKIKDFDWSWHPDETEEPYIYVFGSNQYSAEIMPTIEYAVLGAKQIKYVPDVIATLDVDMTNWEVPNNIDTTDFDFAWKPNPKDPPFIYQFGTQHQKTGGPRYVVPSATTIKYVDIKVRAVPNKDNFAILNNYKIKDFDWSWHPDVTEQPYIYVFGNNQHSAEMMPTIEYAVEGATEIKYINDIVATLDVDMNNWEVPNGLDITGFDFSWKPNPKDPAYIYEFGTQWQKTGGPRHIVPGATETKYIDTMKVKKLPNKKNFKVLDNYNVTDFDYSWHPDSTEAFIYQFGNNQYPAEIMPTIEYAVEGATQIKYVSDIVATLGVDMNNWQIPSKVDTTGFDFSWKPNPKDPAYIYEFGTQWQKTGGPRYIVADATETKYVTTQKVKALPNRDKWELPSNIDVTDFDFSWHPDSTSPPYIYHFATQWALSGGPVYRVEGATEVKYMEEPCAIALPNRDNWEVPIDIDSSSFDFSWHPYVEDQPYIYQFGTQHQKTGGPRYITPGVIATSPVKYIDTRILKSTKLPNRRQFSVLNNYKIKDFDWSWHPDETEEPYIYVFGNTQHPAEIMPTIEYVVPGAKEVKYVNTVVAVLAEDRTNWEIPNDIDVSEFDFSWKPNPKDPPFIYQFGTQWQKTGGPRYVVPDATQVKYVDGSKAKALPNKRNWVMPKDVVIQDFDYSWHPDTTENAYIYVFPTQWQLTAGPRYVVEGAEEYKYLEEPCATAGVNMKHWTIPADVNIKEFDFSWHPHPDDPTYVYHFATQWHDRGGPIYTGYGANKDTPVKYIDSRIIKATLAPNMKNWEVPNDVDATNFDFSWVPHPNDPPFNYQFGTQHQKTGGPRYIVDGATEVKYIEGPGLKAKRLPSKKNWFNPQQSDTATFDYSWHPDDTSPPYIYQFGTLADMNDGPRYITPQSKGEVVYLPRIERPLDEVSNEIEIQPTIDYNVITVQKYFIETTLDDLVNQHPKEVFWALNKGINYDGFDFEWRPESLRDMEYVQVFGSPDSLVTHTYFVNANSYLSGNKDFKFIDNIKLSSEYLSQLFVKPDMFFVDKGNKEAQERFEKIKTKYGNVQKTRYLNSWVDTINRCINRSTTELCWILNSELDYTNFDFNYYPNPWQMKMVHVFGTQWSHWGTTFMVNRETFPTDTKYIKIIEHLSNLNFVKDRVAIASNVVHDVYYIDHGNTPNLPTTNVVPYETDYLTTFKNILAKLPEKKDHYIWIASTVCDYSKFDFSYICDPFAREQLHVFPSDRQKFGDTFFVNVNKLRELVESMTTLQDYGKINYNQHQRVPRLPAPTIISEFDSHVASVMQDFDFPYATFITADNKDIVAVDEEPMSLWDKESKNILITSTGGTRIIVPKEVKEYVETQLYDYPYIKTASKLAKSNPLDIVFLSNGEKCAEENYEHLLKATKGLPNRIVRVDGVNGRVEAYHAAAEASNTPWMFTVFAKLKVNTKFDFNWQPDRLQIPKHYMFLAKNPVNGLIYGHQGMIAYNKEMTLNNPGYGLDFTLDSPHDTIELLSGIATFNTDEWSTWRTAFREVIKLRKENSEVSLKRLEAWMTKADGDYAQYALDGARDGMDYFMEVEGKTDMLRLSYEWAWLRERFDRNYK